MRIEEVELHELVLPLVEPFIISGGTITERRSLVVVLRDEHGRAGYGESPPFDRPFYSEETLGSAGALLRDLLIPRVRGRSVDAPEDVDRLLRDGVRGNPFARAAIDTAAWDLEAARRNTGMAALLGERLGAAPAAAIECGVALGIPEDRSLDTLKRWIWEAVALGYRRVKIKIAPGWDAEPVGAAREALAGTPLPLTVDANGAYRWPDDLPLLEAIDEAGLRYIEQPLAPEELVGHADLGRRLRTPVCLDETLRSAAVARQIAELGGPRIWNIKVHRMGGLTETLAVWREAERYGAELWAGTMPESGIGSQAALAAASLPRFVHPSDLEPSTRWFGRNADVVKLVMGRDGRMVVPRQPIARLLDPARFTAATRRLL